MPEDEGIIGLEDLSEEQWMEIRLLAVKMYNADKFGDDQLKIGIMAFTKWLQLSEKTLAYEPFDFIDMIRH